MSYLKYDGSVAAETPAPTVWLSGSNPLAETLTGTAVANALDGYDGDMLRGGAGDDTYYVKGPGIAIVEAAGAGADKIVAWMNVDLTDFANVENLEVGGDRTYGAGNALDNLIVANGSSSYQLYGGFGQDVLVGSAGRDTFIVVKGTGSDAVYNFDLGQDVVRLSAGYKTFADVQSHMTQVGGDVKIDLGGGEGLIIRNVATGQLNAGHFQLGMDTSKLGVVTFADEFNSLSLWNGAGAGTWSTTFWYDSPAGNGGTLHSNNEQQWYINANYGPTSSVKPWTVDGGQLTLTVAPATPDISSKINGYKYTSGEINTFPSFAQTYGYFEMRADVPDAVGAWPAFWLMPTDGSWPPELDVMEVLTKDPNAVWTTAHSALGGHSMSQAMSYIPDTADGFHTYGVLWTKTDLTWFVDGVEVFKTATPGDMHKPMYMMANLALGGWGGAVDTADLPAQFKIDYIRSFALADGSSTVTLDKVGSGGGSLPSTPPSAPSSGGGASQPSTPSTPSQPASGNLVLTSSGAGDVLLGGSGADTLNASQGFDTLTGGAGADRFVFANEPWAPIHVTDFELGKDTLDLSALFQKAGYAGSAPVTDKFVYFESDGNGGTLIRFDRDATAPGQEWPNTIINLHGVSPAGLTWAQLQGSATGSTGGSGSGGGASTGGGSTAGGGGGGGGGWAGGGSGLGQAIAAPVQGGLLQGGVGADTLTGLNGRNTLFGGDGSDQIVGGVSFNQVNGNKGEDTITGRSLEGDWLLGGQGSDVIDALQSTGANIINGNMGSDTVNGGAGADILRGGQGEDLIFGGGGDDWISGDKGYDTVTGGAGADTIHLSAGSGVVTVTDFDASQGDRILVSGGAPFNLSEQGGVVVVSVAGGGQAFLANTTLATFDAGWVLTA